VEAYVTAQTRQVQGRDSHPNAADRPDGRGWWVLAAGGLGWWVIAAGVGGMALAIGSPPASAQALYGSVVVEVHDDSGAAVPGADVTIVQDETNWTRQGVSGTAGLATFATVPPGTFTIKVSLSGFKEYVTTGVNVAQNDTTRVTSTLVVGQVTDTVTVTAERAVLQTDRADVRTEIESKQLTNLPVPLGRNYQNLFVTIPGVSPPQNMHSVAVNPARGLIFSSGGTTQNSNSIRIEGAISNNPWLPHVAAYIPGLEAIDTVSVVTSTYDADEGLSGGMSANVRIKSGTNEFHGAGFEYFYNQGMKARPYFIPATATKPAAHENQYGGTLGGPIVRDKLFFFGSYEGTNDYQVVSTFGTVPTAAQRLGDLSASPTPIYDPLTGAADGSGRTAFTGNIIPANRLDPTVQKLLALLPMPTNGDIANNYFVTAPFTLDRQKVDAKLTANPSPKLTFAGRLGWLHHTFDSPPMFGPLGGNPVSSAAGKQGKGHGNTVSITGSGSYLVSPSLVIDTYTGAIIMKTYSEPYRYGENLGTDFLGLPGTNGGGPLYSGWPQFAVNSYSPVGAAGSNGTPYIDDNWQYQITTNVTWTHGRHAIKFGGDIVRQALNRFETGAPSGSFTFAGGPTTIKGGPSPNQFNNFATFLLGLPTTVARSIIPYENNYTRSRDWEFSAFAKDTWQVSNKLTASLGLRWDYFPMGTRTTRGLERYDFTNNVMLICGEGSVPTDCGYDMGHGNFSPRLGVAYRATETTVIRGGFGISYDPYPLAFIRDILGNYPSSINLSIAGANSFQYASPLAAGIPPIAVPDVSSGSIPIPTNVTARALDQQPKRGYTRSFNITVQKELGWGFAGQVGYVGTRQRDINQIFDQNAGQVPGAGNAGRPLFVKFGRTVETSLLTNVGWNTYDSLQASLQRRLAKGVQANVSYTWSKAFGICCDGLSDNPPMVQATQYFELNRARLNIDRPHNFTTSVVAELPFGPDKPFLNKTGDVVSAIVRDWQVNALLSAYSGAPFSVTADGTSLNMPGSAQRADQIKADVAIPGHVGPGASYFDPLAFAAVTQPRFGTSGYNTLRGQRVINLDFSLYRQFRLSQGTTLQFRAEAFNLTNTPHFANPSGNVSNMVLNPDGTIRNLGGFSSITGTANTGRDGIDERLFRIGLRLGF
jgi:hypothetical protein